jgi:DNA-binding LacI/PurR family transcriptional regulator
VFVANDDMAIGVIRALDEAGRRVPEHVSVVGFDDIPAAEYLAPPLTTMRQDFGAHASAGLARLTRYLDDPDSPPEPAPDVVTDLVVRESCAGPFRAARGRR